LNQSGGQTLWNALYADFGVKPIVAGNTGMAMGGWFKTPLETVADLNGLRWRLPGLGADMYARLGVDAVPSPPGDILEAFASDQLDAAEFAGPASDIALRLHEAASHYYWPGLHEPNGNAELLVNAELWSALPSDLKAAIMQSAAEETLASLAESEEANCRALKTMTRDHGVTLRRFPDDVIAAARAAADDLYAELRALGGLEGRIATAFDDARRGIGQWPQISAAGFIGVRG